MIEDNLPSKITIVVCSNRLNKLESYTLPSIKSLDGKYKVLILLDNKTKHVDFFFFQQLSSNKNIEVVSSLESGLSNLRNFALRYCKTKYIIFIDDDIFLNSHAIEVVENSLNQSNDIVGLPLRPPTDNYLNRWFITENQYHYLGIHAQSNTTSIWGACMAFNLETIHKNNVTFEVKLDRQRNTLLSGGDTTFINKLISIGAKSELILNNPINHHVDVNRLTFKGLATRVYWQGYTEAVRKNIAGGIKKEFMRNFSIITIKSAVLGIVWYTIFLTGIIDGVLTRKSYL